MEETEKKIEPKRNQNRSPSPAIKSTAVVKYTAFQSPVGYARLQCNTDLNLPPSNWGAAIDSYGLKEILTGSSGFSRMAHMFPDCVGEVDVISGAECIKKLLKLPYQPNGTVSMIVHRVENTLLLDDFCIYDYLMKSEWSWLKDFFYENILKTMSEQERLGVTLAPTPSTGLQLTHKFLSHSVTSLPSHPPAERPQPSCITSPYLPEPEPRAEEPPANEHLYDRNVLWTFEDIHMLIGSDLPIFGDADRPCVSLRLRDAREPINVLTGIDFWLDNLMCNVPEVLMCYHLDGIVQKYEPMKTEDLPNMENSKFSPRVIRNVAQNILSFLKSNATKAGHTYWLFKGPHDDVVKLYDLTSLCPDSVDNPFTTPVAMLLYRVARNMRLTNRTKHVRALLEHALKLLVAERHPQLVASARYMLADLCVPATTDPACPDFHDESSDSETDDTEFSCGDCNPSSSEHKQFDASDRDGDSFNDKGDACKRDGDDKSLALQIRGLKLTDIGDRVRDKSGEEKQKERETKGLGTSPPDRCGGALKHSLAGLQALHYITIDKCKEDERERLKQQIIIEEQHPKMANPYEPIKMDYEPINKNKGKDKQPKEHLSRNRRRKRERKTSEMSENSLIESKTNKDKNAILIHKDKKVFPSLNEPNRDDNFAWKLHLKTLLYEKICLAYATLAEYSYSNEQYGFALKYIDMASRCQKLLSNMIIKSRVVDAGCLLGRLGDSYFQLSKHWHRLEQFKKQFDTDHEIDGKLRAEIENDLVEEVEEFSDNEFDLDISIPENETAAMVASCSHYTRALHATHDKRSELQRRLASVTNELAVRYMHQAQQSYVNYMEEPDQKDPKAEELYMQFMELSKRSQECLDEASSIFEQVKDIPNLALLLCNKGRYMRFRAHCDQGGFSLEKRSLYNQAEDLYQQALKLLGERETCGAAAVWDLVWWELSCHLYTKAVLMQDSPGNYANEVSEVSEALKRALKYCQLSEGPRQYLYQFRAAMIYHRLGSLYHSQYRLTEEEGAKRRTLLNLTRHNYSEAARMFACVEDATMFLTVQAEHVALLEAQAQLSPNLKLKSLQTSIQLLRQCHSIMKVIRDRDPEEIKDIKHEETEEIKRNKKVKENKPDNSDEMKKNEEAKDTKSEDNDEKSMKNEFSLLSLFENRLHFILKNIIQYCRSKSNKDYENMTEMYKKLYMTSLKIRKDNDVRKYASSICDVLDAMDEICKE